MEVTPGVNKHVGGINDLLPPPQLIFKRPT